MKYKPRKVGSGWEKLRGNLIDQLEEWGYPQEWLRSKPTVYLGDLWRRNKKIGRQLAKKGR